MTEQQRADLLRQQYLKRVQYETNNYLSVLKGSLPARVLLQAAWQPILSAYRDRGGSSR